MKKEIQNFVATAKATINAPKTVFAKLSDDKKFKPHMRFFVILWIVGSVLTALGRILFGYVVPLIQQKPMPEASVIQQFFIGQLVGIPLGVILGVLVSLIGTAVLHGWIKLFRGKGNFVKTFQLNVYAMVPATLFGWVPIASLVASFYGMYLTILGIEALHKVTRRKAVIIVISLYVIVWFVGFFVAGFIPQPQG